MAEKPAKCDCGLDRVFAEPWWSYDEGGPERKPKWGLLMHCSAAHFSWHEVQLTDEEQAKAQRTYEAAHASSPYGE